MVISFHVNCGKIKYQSVFNNHSVITSKEDERRKKEKRNEKELNVFRVYLIPPKAISN